MDATVSALLQPTALAAGLARNWVDGLPVDTSVARDLRLLTHEIVSNSVQHAGMNPKDPIRLNIYLAPRWARVEVWDNGPGFSPSPTPPQKTKERGMGLFMLDRLADRWGVQAGECTCVWFEVDLSRTGAGRSPDAPVHARSSDEPTPAGSSEELIHS